MFSRVPRVYLSNQGIVAPRSPEISFNLLLARTRPWGVVTLCDPNAGVAEKYRDSIERNTREQQFDGEGIAELVWMTLGDFCEFKETLQSALPFSLCAVDLRYACPEEIPLT